MSFAPTQSLLLQGLSTKLKLTAIPMELSFSFLISLPHTNGANTTMILLYFPPWHAALLALLDGDPKQPHCTH